MGELSVETGKRRAGTRIDGKKPGIAHRDAAGWIRPVSGLMSGVGQTARLPAVEQWH